MKHLLSLEKLSLADMEAILKKSVSLKQQRGNPSIKPLAGQTWAMIFTKSSTRTRVSFEVGIHEFGGNALFLNANDIQLGRGEPIKDTARVLGRMVHGAIIRTFAQNDVEEFAEFSKVPTINALTDDEHPCQVLTDIFTYEERRGSIKGKIVTFIGDGACNMPVSWIFAAAKLGFELRIAAPKKYWPAKNVLEKLKAIGFAEWLGVGETDRSNILHLESGGKIWLTENLEEAAEKSDLLYTDVWISMGKEAESAERIKDLTGYQINQSVLKLAKKDALVMHCLPAYRGKEIDEETFEANAQTIFDEAENRLHVQKAILSWIIA
jgi:ornithine carbamoyltransferase